MMPLLRGSIHNSHQRFLVSSEVDFLSVKNSLKPLFLKFLAFLPCNFANLVNWIFIIILAKDTHVLPWGKRYHINLVRQFLPDFSKNLHDLRVSPCTVNDHNTRGLIEIVFLASLFIFCKKRTFGFWFILYLLWNSVSQLLTKKKV